MRDRTFNNDWAAVFDMDGVIVDTEPIHTRIERAVFDELNMEVTEEEHMAYVGRPAKEMWTALTAAHAVNRTVEDLERTCGGRYEAWLAEGNVAPLVPGVRDLLVQLFTVRVPLAVASSSAARQIEANLARHDVLDLFSVQVAGDQVSPGKPDPAIYRRAAELLHIDPSRCVAIEDSAAGVRSAKAAGMACVGFLNPSSGRQDLSPADICVDTLTDLTPEYLFSLVRNSTGRRSRTAVNAPDWLP